MIKVRILSQKNIKKIWNNNPIVCCQFFVHNKKFYNPLVVLWIYKTLIPHKLIQSIVSNATHVGMWERWIFNKKNNIRLFSYKILLLFPMMLLYKLSEQHCIFLVNSSSFETTNHTKKKAGDKPDFFLTNTSILLAIQYRNKIHEKK